MALLTLLLPTALLGSSASAADQPVPIDVAGRELAPLTTGRLEVGPRASHEFTLSEADVQETLSEQLRVRGLTVPTPAEGTQDLRYRLGGGVPEVDCVTGGGGVACEVVVDWELTDVRSGAIVYRTQTRGQAAEKSRTRMNSEMAEVALGLSVDSLLSRERFLSALDPDAPVDETGGWGSLLEVRRCDTQALSLPRDLPVALAASRLVVADGGRGSAVVVSPDGFVFTAAHVVSGASELSLVDSEGARVSAALLRVDEVQDIALLQIEGEDLACMSVAEELPPLGAELYTIGSPTGEGLEFSVSKGIVSGIRRFEELRFLQTDVSLNVGNSGGPLFDAEGQLGAIVSWKIAAPGFEGLGFGVPVDAASERLGMVFADSSTPDPQPVDREEAEELDDPADVSRLGSKPEFEKIPLTPRQKSVRTGAWVGGTGLLLGAGSYAFYTTDPDVGRLAWGGMKVGNALGWGMTVGGAALLTRGLIMKPTSTKGSPVHLGVGPGALQLDWTF